MIPRRVTRTPLCIFLLIVVALLVYRPVLWPSDATTGFFHVATAGCRVATQGSSDALLLQGTVLTLDGPIENGHVLVRSGKIVHVGQGPWPGPEAVDATVVACTGSVISPGFINTHEHIDYSTISPFEDLGERVQHRHDWRVGARGHTMRDSVIKGDREKATAWGELRHIFSGTTSIVGGGMAAGLARNLDFAAGLGPDLMSLPATWDVFPLDDSVGILRNGDCDYGPGAVNGELASKYHRYLVHLGEGLDEEAANEFRCLSNKTYDVIPLPGKGGLSADIVGPNLAMVHALGLSRTDFDLAARRGAHVVWSPRSNIFLYGKTLNITHLLGLGINVALGTDWLPSGSATMSREAVCASTATQKSYHQKLEPKTIWEMMTINAAKVVNFEDHLGSLDAGKLADIVVFRGDSNEDPYARAIYAPGENVELVLRGGKILLADGALRNLVHPEACETIHLHRAEKIVCVADELGSSFAEFEASLGDVYPAIFPGTPPGEPSCEPM